jgi:tRNA nucleotidyltransferase (CCA-adding enzyme)
MNRAVLTICEAVRAAGGRALLVGGWVRDHLLGIESKDFDIEVYRVEPARLRALLEKIAPVNAVGGQFAVYKLAFHNPPSFEIDVSLPRRESKSGRGHRGFTIEGDPEMSFEEAARRRDFTVNAILYDPLTDEIIDPFGGAKDLEAKLLRAVAADTFVEDSLRVLRAVQLAARFEMTVEPATAELCRSIDLADLPHERIWGEMEKLFTMAARPSIGLQTALDLGVLDKLFPEIRALVGCPQESEPHAEGDVFRRTKLALDEAVNLAADLPKEKRVTVMLAVLCHGLWRLHATEITEGHDHPWGRDEAARAVMNTLGLHTLGGYDVRSQALGLVREHLRPGQFYDDREHVTDGAFRRLARKLDLDLLYRVAKAVALGRAAASDSIKQEWFIEKARRLGVEHSAPEPILKGRHLIEAGFEPGPRMGEILRLIYDLQLDDQVTNLDEALAAVRRLA